MGMWLDVGACMTMFAGSPQKSPHLISTEIHHVGAPNRLALLLDAP
jgi:hypothetical protein